VIARPNFSAPWRTLAPLVRPPPRAAFNKLKQKNARKNVRVKKLFGSLNQRDTERTISFSEELHDAIGDHVKDIAPPTIERGK
jgi:hypothetical protein